MRFLGILGLVVVVLAFSAADKVASAAHTSIQLTNETGPVQFLTGKALQRGVHLGHVARHKPLPMGDTSSAVCKILCAMSMSSLASAAANDEHIWSQRDERLAPAGAAGADQRLPGLQPPPPR